MPNTWVRSVRGPLKGEVVYVLSPTEVLYVPSSEATLQTIMTKLQARPPPRGFYTLTHKNGKPYSRHHFRNIPRPTREQLLPYCTCTHSALLALPFEGPSPAVTEIGTRVVVQN